jgi:hypothetical protein
MVPVRQDEHPLDASSSRPPVAGVEIGRVGGFEVGPGFQGRDVVHVFHHKLIQYGIRIKYF